MLSTDYRAQAKRMKCSTFACKKKLNVPMTDKNIFIHILKTGGTTINTAMHHSEWQTEVDFNYRHIKKKTKRSNSADIFDYKNIEKYKDYTIFMMVREPVDRLISEYYFKNKNWFTLSN